MTATLPQDMNSNPIQALCPISTQTGAVSSGAAVRLAIPANAKVIRIAATVDCYVAFGNSSVTASSADMVFPTGAEAFSVRENTHVSLISLSATGVASITRMA